MNDERYDDVDRYGERVAALFAAAAETIEPAPDGLTRIWGRIAARRGRHPWRRPLAAAVASAVTAVALLAAAVLVGRHREATIEPAPAGVPVSARSAPDAARQFVRELGFPALDEVIGGTGSSGVSLGRTVRESGQRVPVTTVGLAAAGDRWWVTGARAAGLRVGDPKPGVTVRSPLTVTGWLRGVDEAGVVEVRRYGSPRPLGQVSVSGGGGAEGQPWSRTLRFAGARPGETLLVVARLDSPLDGEPSDLVVVPVQAG